MASTDDSAVYESDDDKRRFIIKLPFVNKASQLFTKGLKVLILKRWVSRLILIINRVNYHHSFLYLLSFNF